MSSSLLESVNNIASGRLESRVCETVVNVLGLNVCELVDNAVHQHHLEPCSTFLEEWPLARSWFWIDLSSGKSHR